jgi:hypothetical protein
MALVPPLQQPPLDDQALQFVMADVQAAAWAGTVGVARKTRERRATNNASRAKRGDLTISAIVSILSLY